MNFRIVLISVLLTTVQSDSILEGPNGVYEIIRFPENFFASRLYEVLSNSTTGNFVISPLSVHMALAVLALGTRGKTLDELRPLLLDVPDINEINDYEVTMPVEISRQDNFHVMNQLFIDKKFKILPEYRRAVKVYRSGITSLDLTNSKKASREINGRCEKYTNGRIKNLVSERDVENAELIIANTVYFKGTWINKFRHSRTYPQTFYLNRFEKKKVLAMHQRNTFNCGELPEVRAKYIKLPYKKDIIEKASEIVRIIDKSVQDGLPYHHYTLEQLQAIDERLDSLQTQIMEFPTDKYDLTYVEENFDKINFFELNASKQLSKVDLSLPKFKISNRSNLRRTLEKLDIKRIFTKEADFTGISKSSKLHVDKIVQKTELEINEDGSEVGSATAIIDVTSSSPRKALRNVRFIVDRPFIVAITLDEFIIFVGRVVDPTK